MDLDLAKDVSTELDLTTALSRALLQTAVIIPVRNEEESLPWVLHDLPDVGVVIVIDNGSEDATASIALRGGCDIVWEPVAGYGRACLAGMEHLERYFSGDQIPIRYVAFLDGDYSDHPEQLNQLLLPIVNEEAEFVLGSRMTGPREPGAMPPQAVWGNRLACFLMRLIWRTEYTDLGPFRVILRDRLSAFSMSEMNFGWTVEMQIKAANARIPTVEIPVSYRRRIGVSKISGTIGGTLRAGYNIMWTIAKYAWLTRKERWSDSTDHPQASIHRLEETY